MKSLIEKLKTSSLFRAALFTLAFLHLVLAGFMSAPAKENKREAFGHNHVDIEGTIQKVLDLNQKKEHQKAIELLLSSVDSEPEDSMMRTLLVQTFDLFLEQEIKQGQNHIAKNRKDIGAYEQVAGSLELLGDNFRAMEILLSGISANPKANQLWMKIARLELKANRHMEALDVFKEVTRLDKKNSDAYNNAAYILAREEKSNAKDLKEALQMATKAQKLNPKNPEYLDTLAEVQFKMGHQNQALSLIEQAIKLAPEQESFKKQRIRFQGDSSLMAR